MTVSPAKFNTYDGLKMAMSLITLNSVDDFGMMKCWQATRISLIQCLVIISNVFEQS